MHNAKGRCEMGFFNCGATICKMLYFNSAKSVIQVDNLFGMCCEALPNTIQAGRFLNCIIRGNWVSAGSFFPKIQLVQ